MKGMSAGARWKRAAIVIVMACFGAVVVAPPASASSLSLKRNDYNGDGHSDILALDDQTQDCLFVSFGSASGTFTLPLRSTGDCGFADYVSLSAVGDITGDGKADIVGVLASDNCLYRWAGTGSGSFGAATKIGCGWLPYWDSLGGAGDLNGDGVGDLVAVNTTDKCLYRWFGNGHGGFGAATQVGCHWDAFILDGEGVDISGVGDVNHDGKADIMAAKWTSHGPFLAEAFIWDGNGAGHFGSAIDFTALHSGISGFGDIDGDGNGDFSGQNGGDGTLVTWLGTGHNLFTQAPPQTGWGAFFPIN